MVKFRWPGFCLRIVVMLAVICAPGMSPAAILRTIEDSVALGEWQPPAAAGKIGLFLPMGDFTPGKKLAVRILLDQPGGTVTVKFFIEEQGQLQVKFKKDCQDNDNSCDLLPQPKLIGLELMDIPSTPITRYIVEVADDSGNKPIVRFLESPTQPSGFTGNVGKIVESLWRLPKSISTAILSGERGTSNSPTAPLQTLVIADTAGQILKTRRITQTGAIHSLCWLPDGRILFVVQDGEVNRLKVIAANLKGAPKDFGHPPLEAVEPHLTSDQQMLVFRQGTNIKSVNLAGTTVTPLIQDKPVERLIGLLPADDPHSYQIIFATHNPELGLSDLWIAMIQGATVQEVRPLPYSSRWFALAAVKLSGSQMVYETLQGTGWYIYLNQDSGQAGPKLITPETSQNRYPVWSPDGKQIVYASNRKDEE